MPEYHQWRDQALKTTHVIKTPDFYIQYGGLQEAARALELARSFKHHKEAVPKMDAALAYAMNRYLAAFSAELRLISYDPLITDEPECVRAPDGDHLAIEIRANASATFANYWPNGPVDLPSLCKVERLSYWPSMRHVDIKEIADPQHVALALLERHLRIRKVELERTVINKSPRDAWRDAKHVLEECPITEKADLADATPRAVTSIASQIIRDAFDDAPMGAGYKDHILSICDLIKASADRSAQQLKKALLGEQCPANGPTALFLRAVR